jgi:hypothetical protein
MSAPQRFATSMKCWKSLRLMRAGVLHADHHLGQQVLEHRGGAK